MEEEKEIKNNIYHEDFHNEGPPFYPNHALKEVMVALLVFGVLLSFAILLPFGLHDKADPLVTPEGIKPEWYFLATYQFIKYIPKIVGILLTGIALPVALILWPFIDSAVLDKFGKKTHKFIGIIALIGALGLSFLGVVCENTYTIFGKKYELDLKGFPHPVKETLKEIPQGEKK